MKVHFGEPEVSQEEYEAVEETRQRRYRKAMVLKEQIGLTDEMRHDLAQLLIGVDKDSGGSWKALNPRQLHDLLTMMEGYAYITYLRMQYGLDTDTEMQ